jgi:acyl-coenzyme A thioesterase PaaI-like protein
VGWPFAELLGMRAASVGDGQARFELDVEPRHLNPNRILHGGVKMSYLAPVTAGTIAADARVVQRTRRIGVLEARVLGDGERLVALAAGTFYVQTARG